MTHVDTKQGCSDRMYVWTFLGMNDVHVGHAGLLAGVMANLRKGPGNNFPERTYAVMPEDGSIRECTYELMATATASNGTVTRSYRIRLLHNWVSIGEINVVNVHGEELDWAKKEKELHAK